MNPILQEINELLQGELPELFASLNPPATQQELHQAEAELGFSLPAELYELYQIHNGEREGGPGLFFGLPFLPLDEMIAEWKIWAELEAEYAEEIAHYSVPATWIKERYINRYWLPISKDWGGNHLGIDLDPDEKGIAGQVINFGRDEEVKYVVARNIAQLLVFIRDSVKAGNYNVFSVEGDVYWSYGRDGERHFLDVIRELDLPVGEPILPDITTLDAATWHESLDDGWKDRIRESSGYPEKFLRAKVLLLIGNGLTDITPLEYCGDVRELILTANDIRSIDALRGCKQVKRLFLTKNPVVDLRPLQGLEYLQELNLSGTAVTDISPLVGLPKLQALDLQETEIRDFSQLMMIKELRSLSVSKPGMDQLRNLGQLIHLRELYIEAATLPNMDFLQHCLRLEKLVLVNTAIVDISALAQLKNLRILELSGCTNIGRLGELARSESLMKITASYQQFSMLKDRFDRKIDFSTITGSMSNEETEIWREYVSR